MNIWIIKWIFRCTTEQRAITYSCSHSLMTPRNLRESRHSSLWGRHWLRLKNSAKITTRLWSLTIKIFILSRKMIFVVATKLFFKSIFRLWTSESLLSFKKRNRTTISISLSRPSLIWDKELNSCHLFIRRKTSSPLTSFWFLMSTQCRLSERHALILICRLDNIFARVSPDSTCTLWQEHQTSSIKNLVSLKKWEVTQLKLFHKLSNIK